MATKIIDWDSNGGGHGELRHYPYRSYGFFGWYCNCGELVEMKLRKNGKLDNTTNPVTLEFVHRNKTRRYTSKFPEGHKILARFEGVLSYADCRVPWQ